MRGACGSRSSRSSPSRSSRSQPCRSRSPTGWRVAFADRRRTANDSSSVRSTPPISNAEGSPPTSTTARSSSWPACRCRSPPRRMRWSSATRPRPRALRDAADATRLGVRSLRSAVMGIHPPDLQRAGLRAGFADLTAPLADDGIQTDVHVPADLILPVEVESLLFRASREAIRNISAHAHAQHVQLDVRSTGRRCDARDRRRWCGIHAGSTRRRPCERSSRPEAAGRSGTRRRWRTPGRLAAGARHDRSTGGAAAVIRVVIADDHRVVRTGLSNCSARSTTSISSASRRTGRRRSSAVRPSDPRSRSSTSRCPAWTGSRRPAGSARCRLIRTWSRSHPSRTEIGSSARSTQARSATC